MSEIIFQPVGGTPRHEGSVVNQAPKAGPWNGAEHTYTGFPAASVSVLPDTGVYNSRVSGRFDDPQYYTA